jgi:RNA polymerase sigma-70 factor (ECF subfamily)
MAVNLFRSESRGRQLEGERAQRLERMIRNDYQLIWRLLRRLGVSLDQVDDAAQHVFLVAAERLDDIQASRERAFAFGTALRVAQSFRRRGQRETATEHMDRSVSTSPGPEELLDQGRARALLQRVLEAMPLELRTVFILFELEAMTSPEIAELSRIPLGTVASRLRRAREKFRVLVEAEAVPRVKRAEP